MHVHLHNTQYEQLSIYQYVHIIMTLNHLWIMKEIKLHGILAM